MQSGTDASVPTSTATASTIPAPASSTAAPPSSLVSSSTSAVAAAAAASASAAAAVKSKKAPISYAAERVIGTGSFGVVYQASVLESGETVAIKKVLQDKRFKNRELQIMSMLSHCNVISLRHCFYSRDAPKGPAPPAGSPPAEGELYLNLVMEFVPATLHRTLRDHTKANRLVPMFLVRLYTWQLLRAVWYIHSVGVCHRDIKPQNLLLNLKTHELKLCDFGSAKQLNPAEPNVSYICSRYYRAPELVFEATNYTTAIDCWSVGAVMGELLLGAPLFPGDSSVDQLIEIIKVLGTPTREEIHAMNPHNTSFKFPTIKANPFSKVFRGKAPADAIDLISRLLRYDPGARIDPLDALAHEFFDPLRVEGAGKAQTAGTSKDILLPPDLFKFTEAEIKYMKQRGTIDQIIPARLRNNNNAADAAAAAATAATPTQSSQQ